MVWIKVMPYCGQASLTGVARGQTLCLSLWPGYLNHCWGAINYEPLPLATVPNVEQGKLTLHPHPYLAPCNRSSWHDGGYVLTLQSRVMCLICWKVNLRLWNVSNSLSHIWKSKSCMIPFWLVSWIFWSLYISVHLFLMYESNGLHVLAYICCLPLAVFLHGCKEKVLHSFVLGNGKSFSLSIKWGAQQAQWSTVTIETRFPKMHNTQTHCPAAKIMVYMMISEHWESCSFLWSTFTTFKIKHMLIIRAPYPDCSPLKLKTTNTEDTHILRAVKHTHTHTHSDPDISTWAWLQLSVHICCGCASDNLFNRVTPNKAEWSGNGPIHSPW